MPVRPIRYGPTQYPLRYRPMGYGSRPPSDELPPPVVMPARTPRRLAIVLAALAATVLAHAGIAFAYLDDRDTATTAPPSSEEVEAGGSCDSAANPDVEDPALSGETGPDAQGRNGPSQPTDAERRLL